MERKPGFFLQILLVAALLFPGSFAFAGSGLRATEKHADSLRIRIVAFGNSITATRATVRQVFAQRIPALLSVHGVAAEVINAGIPGSHTGSVKDHNLFKIRHARDRFETDVMERHPDLVTIGFGTNDAHIDSKVEGGPSRIPLDQFRENLAFMIAALKNNGVKIILITPNVLGEKYGKIQNDRLELYVKTMRRLSRKNRLGLVDNFKVFSKAKKQGEEKLDELLLDGVHPNDNGHEIIAENLTREILKIYHVK